MLPETYHFECDFCDGQGCEQCDGTGWAVYDDEDYADEVVDREREEGSE